MCTRQRRVPLRAAGRRSHGGSARPGTYLARQPGTSVHTLSDIRDKRRPPPQQPAPGPDDPPAAPLERAPGGRGRLAAVIFAFAPYSLSWGRGGPCARRRGLRWRAARNLILQVVDRTGCGSGRHGHCRQVLTWFLSRGGVMPDVAQVLVDEAIGGRFRSWTGPATVLVDDIAERPALSLRPTTARTPTSRRRTTWSAGSRCARPCHGTKPRTTGIHRWPRRATARPKTFAPSTVQWTRPAPRACSPLWSWCGATRPGARHSTSSCSAAGSSTSWTSHSRSRPAFAKGGRERYGIGPATFARYIDIHLAGTRRNAPGLAPS